MKKTTNYINFKGEYVNVENKTLTEIYNDGKLDGMIEGVKLQTELIKVVDLMSRRIASYACAECQEPDNCEECRARNAREITAQFSKYAREGIKEGEDADKMRKN